MLEIAQPSLNMLYEMVTGKVPFEGNTPLSVAMKHKIEAPRGPQELNAQIPDDLNLLILKCLEKDPGLRYRSAAELGRELGKIEGQTSDTEPRVPAGPGRIPVNLQWKKTTPFWAAGVLLTLAVVAGFFLFRGKKEVLNSIAVLPFENVNADSDTEYLCDGITETLINKLSQLSVFKRVISRASSFAYKGKKIDPKKVAQDLGVKTVLTARMVRHGETISISPALVRASDNSQLWGRRYQKEFKNIFAIMGASLTSLSIS
jgi:TolB-like protein